jgi:hypothetical protein
MVVVFLLRNARKRGHAAVYECGNDGFGQGKSARLARPFTTTVIGEGRRSGGRREGNIRLGHGALLVNEWNGKYSAAVRPCATLY